MVEIWKPIKDYEGLYEISNLGRVRSLDKIRNAAINNVSETVIRGRIMKQKSDKDGYLSVKLTHPNSKGKHLRVHRIVATSFICNPESKPQVNHKNGIKSDNNAVNLEWCTLSENRIHAYNTGLQSSESKKGELNNFSKLTESDVTYIKRNYIQNVTPYRIFAEKFNVNVCTIGAIIRGITWKHIKI